MKGSWVYSPDFGTVLDAGVHKLSAMFYPNDPCVKISEITASVEVLKGVARLVWNTPDSILEGIIVQSNLKLIMIIVAHAGLSI
jgi:hypothetical protein